MNGTYRKMSGKGRGVESLNAVPSGAGTPSRTANPLTEPVKRLAAKFRTALRP
jgi:hypothetical protein